MTAFRVIQESLQNVHRHARSSKTWVTISTNQSGIVVEIRDNGEGFRPASTSSTTTGGNGIAGMRERAEVIGAKLAVKSAPGDGTTIKLTIPLNSRALNPVRKTVAREAPRMTERSNM
jgi:two-component system sensor histidine kinase DegS